MNRYTLPLTLTIMLLSCNSSSKLINDKIIAENNKDVFILGLLIQDQLRKTDERYVELNEILQKDSLKRISTNFKRLELKNFGGHISFYYQFAETRKNEIELISREKEIFNYTRWRSKKLPANYDGEIQFNYGERFYNMKRIIVKK